jgi:plastocyanin
MRKSLLAAALSVAISTVLAQSTEHVVSQKGKAFSTKVLTVKVGDTVSFRNDDPFFHNIFSLSSGNDFDLGSYPQGQSRKTTFNKEGTFDVECAIHPEMKMVVKVEKK